MATNQKTLFFLILLFILILIISLSLPGFTLAQVVTDGTMGAQGNVPSGVLPDGRPTTYLITDSRGARSGQNLFHSFSTFKVWAGESATFTSASSGIRNVVSRVTGGEPSIINGTLRSNIEGANLYFLNPWGVLFGPNASLDVKGSLHVSTADYLRFSDDGRFYSVPGPADQVLSTASPAAFGFLGGNPASIWTWGASLEAPWGETLSLIGGDIDITGFDTGSFIKNSYLSAPGGKINLASVASPGEVVPSPAGSTPGLHGQPASALGTLGIHASVLDVSDYSGAKPSGNILIRAGRLVLDQGSWLTADNYGESTGGGIDVLTGTVELSGGSSVSSAACASGDAGGITILTSHLSAEKECRIYGDSFGDGRGGDLSILTDTLSLLGGSSISSHALGPRGDGGNILIRSTEETVISGRATITTPSAVSSRTIGAGNAGRIEIQTPLLNIGEGAEIGADTVLLENNPYGSLGGAGRAGDIEIIAGVLNLSAGGRISNSAYGTTGEGGNIRIRASDSVTISGSDSEGNPSGLFSYSWKRGQGDAGSIFLSAPDLVLSGGATIGADTFGGGCAGNIELDVQRLTLSGGANITSGSLGGSGRGGDIHVAATETLTLSGLFSDISTSTAGAGDGGNITISTNTLTLQDQGAIYADTIGSGQGGDIGVQVTSLSMSGGSRISSSTFDDSGAGGNVTVQAADEISLTGAVTGIGSVSSGSGKGGDIQLRAAALRLADGAQVTASSTGTGDAGSIDIAVTGSVTTRNSKVSTSSKNADGGNIDITAPYMVYLKDSEITASVGGGAATVGGNISIDPQYVILDHSRIIANAFEGQGGNIRIVANVFLADPYSVVDASSALGIDGTVDIRAPITEISGTLVPLGEDFISAFELLREPCMARIRGGKYSSFIVGGRDGLPAEPGRLLPSPMP